MNSRGEGKGSSDFDGSALKMTHVGWNTERDDETAEKYRQLMRERKYAEVISSDEKEDSFVLSQIALSHFYLGNYDLAAGAFVRALTKSRKDKVQRAIIQNNFGDYLNDRTLYDEAYAMYSLAHISDPADPTPLLNILQQHITLGRSKDEIYGTARQLKNQLQTLIDTKHEKVELAISRVYRTLTTKDELRTFGQKKDAVEHELREELIMLSRPADNQHN